MIQLNIPQPDGKSRNVKDWVFTVLTLEQHLTQMQIYNMVKKKYSIQVSYQAVRKALEKMLVDGMVTKVDRKFSISKRWVLDLKSFFDKLLVSYETGSRVHRFSKEMAREDYAIYTFGCLMDTVEFWEGIMRHWLAKAKRGDNFLSYASYSWWMLLNLGKETKIFEEYTRKSIDVYFVFLKDLPLNRWAVKVYSKIGVKAIARDHKGSDETVGVNVMGDHIIQVKYPENIIRRIRKIYHSHPTTQEIDPADISELAYHPCEIKLIMFRNKEIAKSLYESNMRLIRSKQ